MAGLKRKLVFQPDSLSHQTQVFIINNMRECVEQDKTIIKSAGWRITMSKFFDKDVNVEGIFAFEFKNPKYNYLSMQPRSLHDLFYMALHDEYPLFKENNKFEPKIVVMHAYNKHKSEFYNKSKLYCYENINDLQS